MQQLGKVSDHRKKTGSCLSLGERVQLTEFQPGESHEVDQITDQSGTRYSTNRNRPTGFELGPWSQAHQ
jgi:hypothetical protein